MEANYNITIDDDIDITTNSNLCEIMNAMLGIDLSDSSYFKWYTEEEDMMKFSKLFPKALFTLDAVGEDGEYWRNYYKNGKCESAKIVTTYSKCSL